MTVSSISISKYNASLIAVISTIVVTITIANIIGEETATFYGYIISLLTGGLLVGVSFWAVRQFGIDGIQGTAWMALVGFALLWVIADAIWNLEEIFLDGSELSSADLVYVMGYPFLLMFLVSYMIPFLDVISKKLIAIALVLSIISVVVLLYVQFGMNSSSIEQVITDDPSSWYGIIIVTLYPIADGVILFPTILGIGIFLRDTSKVRPMWVLIFFGTLTNFAADVIFMWLEPHDEYFTGHPVDILFFCTYVLIAFGVYGYGKNDKNYFMKKQ